MIRTELELSIGSCGPRHSGKVRACEQCRVPSWSSRKMPSRDSRICPPRHPTLGEEPIRPKRLLAERIGGHWEIHNHSVVLGSGCKRWIPRCQLLLLPGLFRSKGTQKHLSHPCIPTRMSLPPLPKPHRHEYQEGPSPNPRLPHFPAREPPRQSTFQDRDPMCHRYRCVGRVHR
jgi:hypothetical protein